MYRLRSLALVFAFFVSESSTILFGQDDHGALYPSIFILKEKVNGFTSVGDLKMKTKDAHRTRLWEGLLEESVHDFEVPFLDPTIDFPGRDPVHLRHANVSYDMALGVERRLFRSTLLYLVTEETKYKDLVLRQLEALFDDELWPMWCDDAHAGRGGPDVDIRTFRLSMWVALSYNWLHDYLTDSERSAILEGLDRRAIQPFWEKLATRPSWYIHRHNWFTNMFGGMGITAMALGDDHPETQRLLDTIVPQMIAFNDVFGEMGEFNEPPGYSGAIKYSVEFAESYRYYTGNGENLLEGRPFANVAYWVMMHTLPPGRMAEFGDTKKDRGFASLESIAAIANANEDEILQWYYMQNFKEISSPFELLWYNPQLPQRDPSGVIPLGTSFREYGASIISRTSWDPVATDCVVYGKSGRETNHDDNDVGQLLIDGFGDRLIIDAGKPDPIYPKDYFGANQFEYYTRSSRGHNVMVIGGEEMRSEPNELARGSTTSSFFDDSIGSSWSMDLTPVYDNADLVTRSVAHLFPGIVVVLDQVRLPKAESIELRWHTGGTPQMKMSGSFFASGEQGRVVGQISSISNQELSFDTGEHRHKSPFNLTRQGDPLIQEYHPFIRIQTNAKAASILTLFAITQKSGDPAAWKREDKGWSIVMEGVQYNVILGTKSLSVSS